MYYKQLTINKTALPKLSITLTIKVTFRDKTKSKQRLMQQYYPRINSTVTSDPIMIPAMASTVSPVNKTYSVPVN